MLHADENSLVLSWRKSSLPDLAGYRVYYDTDSTGFYRHNADVGRDTLFSLDEVAPGKSYRVAVTTYDTEGEESWYSREVVANVPTNIGRQEEVSQGFTLEPPFPNPARTSTTIAFTLEEAAELSLAIYDVMGRRIKALSHGFYHPGRHEITAHVGDVASGLYVVRAQKRNSGGNALVRKLVVLR